QFAALEVREVKCAILLDRSAQSRPVLHLSRRQLCIRQRISRVPALVAHKTIQVAVNGISATPRDHVDVPAQRTPELRLSSGSDDLEFIHHIQTVEDASQTGGVIVSRQPVYQKTVREVTLARYRDALPRHCRRFGEKLVAGSVGR